MPAKEERQRSSNGIVTSLQLSSSRDSEASVGGPPRTEWHLKENIQTSSRQRSTDGHKEVFSTARWADGLASDASGSISGVQGVMTALQASSQPSILKTNSSAVANVNAGGAATRSFSFPSSIFFNIVCFVQWGGRRVVVLGPSPPLFLFCPLIMTTKKRKFSNHSDVIKININANAEVAESKQNQCQSFCLRRTMMSPPLGPTPYPNTGLSKRVGHPGGLTSLFAVCRQPLGAFNKADPRRSGSARIIKH
ncbi:hypothetical protein TNIN_122001 [Trichonephila inaurata madagascariensis]|uniref:Uncharacterized protein n=1 Tax=Trichonephila inaurata madagascariensis TaxID=2747483 RepID=A0A8X6WR09_9ARAC|nr:hypothetical protein TNIN_122001 [Trichonephila inaurata madagascariensis]